MAKAAKEAPKPEITERSANKFIVDIQECFDNIESARGKYMNAARKQREAMTTIYEGMAARFGMSQKASKSAIKIHRAMEKIKGWMADLEAEDRKMVQKLAKARADKKQLLLFGELPPAPKAAKTEKPEPDEGEDKKPARSGVTGEVLAQTEAAGNA